MKTKEKIVKLIFIFLTTVFFSLLFSMGCKIQAVTITGEVVDENGSPIGGVEINHGGKTATSNENGKYEIIDGSGDNITYTFSNKKIESAEANTKIYKPADESKKYNVVIVKPENDCQNEYEEIKLMLSNCKINNEVTVTYKEGEDPNDKYNEIYSTKNDRKNLFIILDNGNISGLKIEPQPIGDKSPLVYECNGSSIGRINGSARRINNITALEEYMKQYANLSEPEEKTLEIAEVSETNVKVKLAPADKSQKIILKIKEKEEEVIPGVYAGNIIEGEAKDEFGNPIEGVLVQLCETNGDVAKTEDGTANIETRTTPEGKYTLSGIPGAIWDEENQKFIPKDYKVKFTYGDREQLTINTKYNGQDYCVKDDGGNVIITTESKDTTEEIEEIKEQEEEKEEGVDPDKKIDVYFVIDCSSSMDTVVENVKKELKTLTDKLFDVYGDNIKIGIITYGKSGNFTPVEEELILSNKSELDHSIQNILDGLSAVGHNYNELAIKMAKESLFSIGRADSEKHIIMIGDGVANNKEETKQAYIDAVNSGINMFSLLLGDQGHIQKFWDLIIIDSLAGTDWYYSDENNTSVVLENIAYQYLLGNRDFVENREYLTEDGTKNGKIGTAINISKNGNSIATEDEIRRGIVNDYTKVINNELRK